VPIPSLESQQDIAGVFKALDRKEKAHELKKKSLSDLFRTLLHQLMTAQIRVNDIYIGERELVL
jgi:type I restriction enzyme S subunit